MSVVGVTPRCWIMALFIRDDGERLLLGDGWFQFKDTQKHFVANDLSNTVIEAQGSDGVFLSGQVRRSGIQPFDGYIGDGGCSKEEIEVHRMQFISFFMARHFYEVVYIDTSGSAMKRQRGFLVDAPSVEELYQIHPEYHVAVQFEDVNYYAYDEDDSGEEIYGESAQLYLYNAVTGGFPWDAKGAIWLEDGEPCKDGIGGTTSINVKSIEPIYPVWTVNGLADDPQLVNLATGQTLSYHGRVAPSQTLVIDMLNRTALLDGDNVLTNITGEWIRLVPGVNQINYITENDNAVNSNLKWQEIIE